MKALIVLSGKGGVGKSTIAVGIARSIAQRGVRTGLIDMDIESPSVPTLTSTSGDDIKISGRLLEPAITSDNIKVFSIGHLLPSEDTPILWEGEKKENIFNEIFKSFDFSDIEYLIVDMPPGSGDELYGVRKVLNFVSAVIITLPQRLSLVSAKKALNAAKRYDIPVLGIIENMSGFLCPQCHTVSYIFRQGAGRILAETNGVELLGTIPMLDKVCEESDMGSSSILMQNKEFKEIVEKIMKKMGISIKEKRGSIEVGDRDNSGLFSPTISSHSSQSHHMSPFNLVK